MKKNVMKKLPQSGFTLIEILIVIGVIAILAAIVLVAVNPAKQFRDANNAQRSSNVNAILNAVGQYMVDNRGLSGMAGEIPDGDADDAVEIGNGTGEADLCDLLVPEFIAALPADPDETAQSVPVSGDDCNDSYRTSYEIYRTGDRITIMAPNADPDISVTR